MLQPRKIKTELEQCNLCSAQYEKPSAIYAQPDLNRLICKVLQLEPPGPAYFNQYIPICSACATRLRTYDKQRVALDILRQEIVTSVLDTILHIRPYDNTPLHHHTVKNRILDRWSSPGGGVGGPNLNLSSAPSGQSETPVSPVNTTLTIPPVTVVTVPQTGPTQFVRSQNFGKSLKSVTPEARDTNSVTAAALASILPSGTSADSVNIVTWEQCDGVEGHWNVGGEVSVSSADGQPTQIITNYVAEDIFVENEVVCEEGSDDQNEASDDGEPYDDPGAAGDSDYAPAEKRKAVRKQVLSNMRTDQRPCEQSTVDLGDLTREGTKAKPKRVRSRTTGSGSAPQHRKPPFFCEACGRVFSKMQTLRCHIKRNCKGEGEEEKYSKVCSMCSQDFTNFGWSALKLHIDQSHSNVVLEKCRFCRSEFLPNTFQNHRCPNPGGSGRKDYPCDYCDKIFHNTSGVSEHIRRQHNNGSGKRFKCETCGKSFKSNSILGYHQKQHQTIITPFSCDQCGICTTTAWGLREHQKVHTGERPFACEVCGKTFRIKNILKNHMVVHTKEKNFVCEICNKSFSLYCTMLRHWKLHMNPIPGAGEYCPICTDGPRFKKNRTLKDHMILRHPGSEEQIEICARPLDAEEEELAKKKEEALNNFLKRKLSDKDSGVKRKVNPKNRNAESESSCEEDAGVTEEVDLEDDNIDESADEVENTEVMDTTGKAGSNCEKGGNTSSVGNRTIKVEMTDIRTTPMSTRFGGLKRVCPSPSKTTKGS